VKRLPWRFFLGLASLRPKTWHLSTLRVSTVDNTTRELLERAYSAFNARDIDSALATMHH
jgi:hypothetical protein